MQMAPSMDTLGPQAGKKGHFFLAFLTDFETYVRHLRHPFLAVEFLAQTVCDCHTHTYHPPRNFSQIQSTTTEL